MADASEGNVTEHIPDEDIAAFLNKSLQPQRRDAVIAHLAECSTCRTLVTESERSRKFAPDPNERSK